MISFSSPETFENRWCSDVFKGDKKETLAWNSLRWTLITSGIKSSSRILTHYTPKLSSYRHQSIDTMATLMTGFCMMATLGFNKLMTSECKGIFFTKI